MKNLKIIGLALALTSSISACDKKKEFVDLRTGKEIELEKDSTTGAMVNTETREPVNIYVKKSTNDTIYGPTGEVINNKVVRTTGGEYTYYKDGAVKYENGNLKEKLDKDGDYKVKDGDYKLKIDKDGDIKIKNGETVVKIDGETGKKKVKKDL